MKTSRIMQCLVAIVLIATPTKSAAQTGTTFEDGDFKYVRTFDNVVYCTGYTSTGAANHWTAPNFPLTAKYNSTTYYVSGIAEGAFSGDAYLTTVTLEPGYKEVKASAFASCPKLATVRLPGTMTSVDLNAFNGCTALTTLSCNALTPPSDPGTTHNYALTGVTLQVPNVSGLLAKYQSSGYWGGSTFKTVEVNNALFDTSSSSYYLIYITEAPTGAKPTGSNNAIRMDGLIFNRPGANPSGKLTIDDYVQASVATGYQVSPSQIDNKAFYGMTGITEVAMTSHITKIGTSAFEGCTSLASVKSTSSYFSLGIVEIGSRAFANTAFTTFELPASVTTMVTNAFDDCTNFTDFTVNNNNAKYSAANGLVFNKEQTTLVRVPVARDPSDWFDKDMPVTFSAMGTGSCAGAIFSGSSSRYVQIPPTVKTIYNYVFENSNITTVVIPSSVTSIGNYSFYNSTVGYINIGASQPPTTGTDIFHGCSKLNRLEVPVNAWETYATATDWKKFPTIKAGGYDFYNYYTTNKGDFIVTKAATTDTPGEVKMVYGTRDADWTTFIPTIVTCPANGLRYKVTALSDSVFAGNNRLLSAHIPASFPTLPRWAFENCTKLAQVTYDEGFEPASVGYRAFWGTAIKEFEVPATAKVIQKQAFDNCASLEKLIFNRSLATTVYSDAYGVTNPNANLKVYVSWTQVQNWCDSVAQWSYNPKRYLNEWVNLGEYTAIPFSSYLPIEIPSELTAYAATDYKISGNKAKIKRESTSMIKGNYGTAVMLEGEPNTRYLLPTNLVADYYNVTNNLVGTSAITNFTGEETDAAYFTYDYVTPWQFDHITFNTRVRRGFAYLKLPYDEFKNVSIVEMVDNINAVAKGDVNGDGVVNGSDVTALYNVLLDNAIPGGDADVNGDGVVNGSDVTALYNLLLEQ